MFYNIKKYIFILKNAVCNRLLVEYSMYSLDS